MFEVGKEYHRRSEIHGIYRGQAQGGISTPKEHPVVFVFTSDEGAKHGYKDEYREDGIFWYTGEGQKGPMRMESGNKAIRDHKKNNKTLHIFEYTKRAYVRYVGVAECIGFHEEQRPDNDGMMRSVFIFHLDIDSTVGISKPEVVKNYIPKSEKELRKKSLSDLRVSALEKADNVPSVKEKLAQTYYRSQAIKLYSIKRSNGFCEACNDPAPFLTRSGPFLECHHLHRISDGGPDHPENVIALCPNCHRKAHYSIDSKEFSKKLKSIVMEAETRVSAM
ncbi:HNH endonuclease [Sansalvadorimonas verongulae]|uniref:HNH endonuclease n=1 Tax=Sansalvadorimonas verongulae TaxID=2172824 RepID=UPI002E36A9BF|nr:HNH endonuclease [Sansalvadorimonas verongulae]MTI15572.1 HNH endonuclease [Sansalvadorimonas verongulae]